MSHCVWKDDLKQIRANWGFSQIRIGFHNSRLSGLDATRRAETGFQYYTEKKKSGNEIIDLLLKLCFKNAVLLCISFNLTEKNKSTQQQSNEFPPPVCTSLASLLKTERKTTGQKVNNYHIFQTSGTPPSWSPINRALRQTVNGGAAEISDSMTIHRAEIWICGNCFGHAVLSLLWRANVLLRWPRSLARHVWERPRETLNWMRFGRSHLVALRPPRLCFSHQPLPRPWRETKIQHFHHASNHTAAVACWYEIRRNRYFIDPLQSTSPPGLSNKPFEMWARRLSSCIYCVCYLSFPVKWLSPAWR